MLWDVDPQKHDGCLRAWLEPGGALGHGYLTPYKVNQAKRGERPVYVMECQFIAGYRGLAKLARNSGEVEIIEAHPVYPGDKFIVRRGTVTELIHEPDYQSGEDRTSGASCYYAMARYKSGAVQFEVMTRAQIETIMRSTQSKGDYGPWADHFDEQARKTCIRRLAKSLPLESEKFARALEMSDARDEGDTDIEIPVDVVSEPESLESQQKRPSRRSRPRYPQPNRLLHVRTTGRSQKATAHQAR